MQLSQKFAQQFMSKNSDNNLENFVDHLNEKTISKPDPSFEGNSIEESQNLSHAQILLNELNDHSTLTGSIIILRQNFLTFAKVNLALTVAFLAFSFALIFFYGDLIYNYSTTALAYLPFLKTINITNILHVILAILFFLFFTWMRSSYLTIISNYICGDESLGAFRFGLIKILSFILAEVMQLVMFIIGAFMLVLSPFFGAKYYLTLPIIYSQNDGAINSMFESREYSHGQMLYTLRHMFAITFFTTALIVIFYFITTHFIQNQLILLSLNFLIFSFLILPFHACYRFFLYKKLQNITGEMRFETNLKEKIWFVFSRVTFLLLLVINIYLIANGSLGDSFDKVMFLISSS